MVLDVSPPEPSGSLPLSLSLFASGAPLTEKHCSAHEFLSRVQEIGNVEVNQQESEPCERGSGPSPAKLAKGHGSASLRPPTIKFLIGNMMAEYTRTMGDKTESDVGTTVDKIRGSPKSLTAYVPSFGFAQRDLRIAEPNPHAVQAKAGHVDT